MMNESHIWIIISNQYCVDSNWNIPKGTIILLCIVFMGSRHLILHYYNIVWLFVSKELMGVAFTFVLKTY